MTSHHTHMHGQKRLITVVSLAVLITSVLVLGLLWAWPKSFKAPTDPGATIYYRGLGLRPEEGHVLGLQFYAIEYSPTQSYHGTTTVRFVAEGYNAFHGEYPNGSVRESGECFVEVLKSVPAPVAYRVKHGKYYVPDGRLGSTITNGTGKQTYWTPAGIKIWELELRNYQRVCFDMWYDDGQAWMHEEYEGDKMHGPYRAYYPNGQLRLEGQYTHGKRTGEWIEVAADGTTSIDDRRNN